MKWVQWKILDYNWPCTREVESWLQPTKQVNKGSSIKYVDRQGGGGIYQLSTFDNLGKGSLACFSHTDRKLQVGQYGEHIQAPIFLNLSFLDMWFFLQETAQCLKWQVDQDGRMNITHITLPVIFSSRIRIVSAISWYRKENLKLQSAFLYSCQNKFTNLPCHISN